MKTIKVIILVAITTFTSCSTPEQTSLLKEGVDTVFSFVTRFKATQNQPKPEPLPEVTISGK